MGGGFHKIPLGKIHTAYYNQRNEKSPAYLSKENKLTKKREISNCLLKMQTPHIAHKVVAISEIDKYKNWHYARLQKVPK